MINARRFSHVTFETPDIERQIAYFTEIAGLAVAERHNGQRLSRDQARRSRG